MAMTNTPRLVIDDKGDVSKIRDWPVCEAFDGEDFQLWLNENPDLREQYLDWYEKRRGEQRQ